MFNYDGSIYLGAVKETIIRFEAEMADRFLPKPIRAYLGMRRNAFLCLLAFGWLWRGVSV